jgi:predicted AlkP superfamily phosphohydrolase/phosphomutase
MKLLILALDGFDPDLFLRWRDELPNLNQIAKRGFFSPLRSTIPPMTFPAWSTFLTGVNPGRHGIFDFTERLLGRLAVRFVNSSRRRYPTFLRLLSEAGLRVGSIGLPTTYPPEGLSGYQISGFDTPLPSKADASYVYPRDLAGEIDRHLGGYFFGDFNESRIGVGWHGRVLCKLLEGLRRKRDLVRFLQNREPVDLLLLHVGETDTVGHHYWSFCDAQSPRHIASTDSTLTHAISTVYRSADDLVGELMEICRPDDMLVVSDHGMGGTSDRVIYLNRFLAEKGFLRFKAFPLLSSAVERAKIWGMKWIPYRMQQQAFKLAGGLLARRIESQRRFGGLDWEHTVAYSEELNYFPAIWLNLQGREPFGVVSPNDSDQKLDEIRSALLEWRDPSDGSAVVKRAWRREEVYNGPEIIFAPDLILELNRPNGYSFALGNGGDSKSKAAWRRLEASEYIGHKGLSMNGSHRPLGTFMATHARFLGSDGLDLNLLDVAPMIFARFGLPAPAWLEGRAWGRIPQAEPDRKLATPGEAPYSPTAEADIRRRLVDLGYLS